MKSKTIVEKIKRENACSVHTAELLTNAFHREGKLSADKAIRFKPLYGTFEIVNADFKTKLTDAFPISFFDLQEMSL